jgi:uncharacterized protein YyaL (SSP411 family)
MEKESFEDEATAEIMNRYFINIKIDREERPDIDHIYMDAVQAMTGSGGWPLNVFLTPDKKPFYGGTYFPPIKAHSRSSWKEVLMAVQQAWTDRSTEIETQANELTEHLLKSNSFGLSEATGDVFSMENCHTMFANIQKTADKEWGGFGKAPKFPQTFTIQYLLRYYYLTQNKEALQQALLSIDKMLLGGIYDHVGGGLCRYSTDIEWLAPHFEKMLYDNALFIIVLSEAYQITKEEKYKYAIFQIASFVKREMTDIKGGFYAAFDADSEGEEGKFYVWDKKEIETILGNDAELFCKYFDVTDIGNWEGKNILRILSDKETFAQDNHLTVSQFSNFIHASFQQLFTERNKRIRPITDDKILLGWNALMITALSKAAMALNDDGLKNEAVHQFGFIKSAFKVEEGSWQMHHTYKNGEAKYPAFLDDYACLIQACLHLQEVTSEANYLITAKEICVYVMENFSEEETGYFFFTPKQQADVIMRKKEVYDGAVPSGNSIMAANLTYLSIVFDKPEWKLRADKMLSSLSKAIINYPGSFGIWAAQILYNVKGIAEIAITGNRHFAVRDEYLKHFLPGNILQTSAVADEKFPLLRQKNAAGKTFIYVCKNYACSAPLENLTAALKIIQQNHQ